MCTFSNWRVASRVAPSLQTVTRKRLHPELRPQWRHFPELRPKWRHFPRLILNCQAGESISTCKLAKSGTYVSKGAIYPSSSENHNIIRECKPRQHTNGGTTSRTSGAAPTRSSCTWAAFRMTCMPRFRIASTPRSPTNG